MQNIEQNNWGVSNWTHPIFRQGGNGIWKVVSNRGAPLWGKWISRVWEYLLQSLCHELQLSHVGTANNNMSSNCYPRDYCSFHSLQILQHEKLTVNVSKTHFHNKAMDTVVIPSASSRCDSSRRQMANDLLTVDSYQEIHANFHSWPVRPIRHSDVRSRDFATLLGSRLPANQPWQQRRSSCFMISLLPRWVRPWLNSETKTLSSVYIYGSSGSRHDV